MVQDNSGLTGKHWLSPRGRRRSCRPNEAYEPPDEDMPLPYIDFDEVEDSSSSDDDLFDHQSVRRKAPNKDPADQQQSEDEDSGEVVRVRRSLGRAARSAAASGDQIASHKSQVLQLALRFPLSREHADLRADGSAFSHVPTDPLVLLDSMKQMEFNEPIHQRCLRTITALDRLLQKLGASSEDRTGIVGKIGAYIPNEFVVTQVVESASGEQILRRFVQTRPEIRPVQDVRLFEVSDLPALPTADAGIVRGDGNLTFLHNLCQFTDEVFALQDFTKLSPATNHHDTFFRDIIQKGLLEKVHRGHYRRLAIDMTSTSSPFRRYLEEHRMYARNDPLREVGLIPDYSQVPQYPYIAGARGGYNIVVAFQRLSAIGRPFDVRAIKAELHAHGISIGKQMNIENTFQSTKEVFFDGSFVRNGGLPILRQEFRVGATKRESTIRAVSGLLFSVAYDDLPSIMREILRSGNVDALASMVASQQASGDCPFCDNDSPKQKVTVFRLVDATPYNACMKCYKMVRRERGNIIADALSEISSDPSHIVDGLPSDGAVHASPVSPNKLVGGTLQAMRNKNDGKNHDRAEFWMHRFFDVAEREDSNAKVLRHLVSKGGKNDATRALLMQNGAWGYYMDHSHSAVKNAKQFGAPFSWCKDGRYYFFIPRGFQTTKISMEGVTCVQLATAEEMRVLFGNHTVSSSSDGDGAEAIEAAEASEEQAMSTSSDDSDFEGNGFEDEISSGNSPAALETELDVSGPTTQSADRILDESEEPPLRMVRTNLDEQVAWLREARSGLDRARGGLDDPYWAFRNGRSGREGGSGGSGGGADAGAERERRSSEGGGGPAAFEASRVDDSGPSAILFDFNMAMAAAHSESSSTDGGGFIAVATFKRVRPGDPQDSLETLSPLKRARIDDNLQALRDRSAMQESDIAALRIQSQLQQQQISELRLNLANSLTQTASFMEQTAVFQRQMAASLRRE